MFFSHVIEEFVLDNYDCKKIASLWSATGEAPIYLIEYKGKHIAFLKTCIGAPACAGIAEELQTVLRTDRYVVFGGAGCLDKEIAHGRIMVPTEAYRDEGTSYHYVPAADYITIKNADTVAGFMQENGIPYIMGKTWTTDAFYRETRGNFAKRRAEGCISVEMECAALQAVCNFRGLSLYQFFTSGDLLDAPEWDERCKEGELKGTQHDSGYFNIALELAHYTASL